MEKLHNFTFASKKKKKSTVSQNCYQNYILFFYLLSIKSFKSSLDFLKNLMKKFDLLWEHWFFLKTNTSILLNFTDSAKGRKHWEMPHFLFPTAPWKDHEEDRYKPKASPTPLTGTGAHTGLMITLSCATQPSTSRQELSDRWSQGKPFKCLRWVMTGLPLFNSR